MIKIDKLIQRVQKSQHGFLDIQKAANEVIDELSSKDSLRTAKQLFNSEIHQARCLATFIFGGLAANSNEAIEFLKCSVSKDNDWRVQEILSKAFDRYCSDVGYEKALPTIKEWLADSSPNVRRAVTEGLRIWTGRPFFRDHPEIAIQFLSQFRDDNSEYVRKSVGNALRDISKKHRELVNKELGQWDTTRKNTKQTYNLAIKFVQKSEG
jgi:3-methyladenine DNA glycosylase AlkC